MLSSMQKHYRNKLTPPGADYLLTVNDVAISLSPALTANNGVN